MKKKTKRWMTPPGVNVLLRLALIVAFLGFWEGIVRLFAIPLHD